MSARLELTTLTDGGQAAFEVAGAIADFLNDARESLDLALYDVRLESDAGALVLASLLAAHQRGVRVRLAYNVAHPGPIPVPPPPETRPEAIEALPVETRAVAGVPDLMHHKFCVRDGRDVWTGSMNWTEDSWTRQENVVVRVLGAERLAYAFTLAFEQLWEHVARCAAPARSSPGPVDLDGGVTVRPWFTPGHGEALSHRVAKHVGRASRRIRIASPVLTAGPLLGTLVEVVNERRCDVAGVIDDTQVDEVVGQWRTNGVSAWKIPLLQTIVTGRAPLRQALDALVAGRRPGRHAREGRRRRRRLVRRLVQLLALGRAQRGERARDRGHRDRRRARGVRGRGARPLSARDAAGRLSARRPRRQATPASRKARLSFSISRAITSRCTSWVPS